MVTFRDIIREELRVRIRQVYRYENSPLSNFAPRVAQALHRITRYDSRCSIGRGKEYPRFGEGVR